MSDDDQPPQPAPRRRRAAVVAVALIGMFTVYGLVRLVLAVQAGTQGRAALVRAEDQLESRDVDAARAELEKAGRAFRRMRSDIRGMGPLLVVGKLTPVVSAQIRGAEALAGAGIELSRSGRALADAADDVLDSGEDAQPFASALDALRRAHGVFRTSTTNLATVDRNLKALDRSLLLGPLGSDYAELRRRLPLLVDRLGRAERGAAALVTFAGGDGPRRYLVLTQNPDEPRPTGGFIGTYGVLTATNGTLALDRFDGIGSWERSRPPGGIPAFEAPSPFRFGVAGPRQTLSNVNAVPDWPAVAELAMDMWVQGGEEPVHGVVSMFPALMVRVVRVTGPVKVPKYNETVKAANLIERIDFHTHDPSNLDNPDRKDFVAALAEAVLEAAFETPPDRWGDLAEAIGAGFDAGEVVAYSRDAAVQQALAEHAWHGALPEVGGDFFYNSEFSYAAKNGRGLRRTFDHHVAIRSDGSALVTTVITIDNTLEHHPVLNRDSLTYLTVYGPAGATLAASSDPPVAREPPMAGHPAAGWFVAAAPLDHVTVTVAWEVPDLVGSGRSRAYQLRWLKLPDHSGDVVNLQVDLPEGWRWEGEAPPERIDLERDVAGSWPIATGR